jgi:hypothetical protein
MVNVPVLEPVPGLLATENLTVPFPVPLWPDVMVTQPTLLVAVHAQPVWVVTLALPVPPPDPNA